MLWSTDDAEGQPTQLINCQCGCGTLIPPLVGQCMPSLSWGQGALESQIIIASMAGGMLYLPQGPVYVEMIDSAKQFNISPTGRTTLTYGRIAQILMELFAQMGEQAGSLRYCPCRCGTMLPPNISQCYASAYWQMDAPMCQYIHAANAVGLMFIPQDASTIEVRDTDGRWGLDSFVISTDELNSWLPTFLGTPRYTGM